MSSEGYSSPLAVNSDANEFNKIAFVIQQMMGRLATTALVKVIAVKPGAVGPVGTVDVQPMVNQIDGVGNATAHGTIYGLPYVRLQGGANAVIIDPVVGDIGWAGFCSTDISAAKSTKAVANPGSRRRYDWADGLYLGAMLGATPTQFIQFAGGVNIDTGGLFASDNLGCGSGASGSFSTPTGQVVTVLNGIITDIS